MTAPYSIGDGLGGRRSVAGPVPTFDLRTARYALKVALGEWAEGARCQVDSSGEVLVLVPGGKSILGRDLCRVADALTLAQERGVPGDPGCQGGAFPDGSSASTPWVDYLGDEWRALCGAPPYQRAGGGFEIIITHDLDHTTSLEPTAIAGSLLRWSGVRAGFAIPLWDALKPGHLRRAIESILHFEQDQGVRAIYFMLSGPYGLGRYSSRTSCTWRSARAIARLVVGAGMEIGLHGSYGAGERSGYRDERRRLEDQVERSVVHHRNHYLRFDALRVFSQLEDAGILWDHTFGFPARVGFRAGTARPYPGFDLLNKRPSTASVIPMVMMDTAIADRNATDALALVRRTLEEVRRARGCVSVNFHPERLAASRTAMDVFRETVFMARELGADITSWDPRANDPKAQRRRRSPPGLPGGPPV